MQLDHLNTHQVHQVARFSAAAAAAAHGYPVEVVGPRTRLRIADKVVQVLSRRQPGSPWQTTIDAPTVPDAYAVVFVDLTGDHPDFFVALAAWVNNDVQEHYRAWLAASGGERPRNPNSTHTAIPIERVQRWHRRWDVLNS